MPEDQSSSRPVADNFARRFAPPELYDPKKRREWKLGRNDEDRGPYIVELNLQHVEGLPGAMGALELLLEKLNSAEERPPRPDYIAKTYARCLLNLREWQQLLANDAIEAEKLARRDWETERQAMQCGTAPSINSGRIFQSKAKFIVPSPP
jgi:serine protease AprX